MIKLDNMINVPRILSYLIDDFLEDPNVGLSHTYK
jgi:hypothetical protein